MSAIDLEKLKVQSAEFDTLRALYKAYNVLPQVVDDEYLRLRHNYEGALYNFIDALRKNGRI